MRTLYYTLAATIAALSPLHAAEFTTVYNFNSTSPNYSESALLVSKKGVVQGNASGGGPSGTGAVFRLKPNGAFKVLHAFNGTSEGFSPSGPLIADSKGTLYGTATQGGDVDKGVMFKLTAKGAFSVVHNFGDVSTDGIYPSGGLVRDKQGNFYGAASQGAAFGYGCLFEIDKDGNETILYSFAGPDGSYPGSLTRDSKGDLYGVTGSGGDNGDGVVFKFAPGGTMTILHNFNGTDGRMPSAGLVVKKGVVYGTVYFGGANNLGAVYKLAANRKLTLLHSFSSTEGNRSRSGVVMDSAGNLFGTTDYGGSNDHGTVFELAPDGTLTALHVFNGTDGDAPRARPTLAADGSLYGTTFDGGTSNSGTVYKISP